MAWVNLSWTYLTIRRHSTGTDLEVCWRREDDAQTGVYKDGAFVYTIVAGETWTVTEAAIEAKVTAEDGLHS